MKIQKSAENYLETILMLQNQIGQVRSIDIVNSMRYTKPSVSYAMKLLRENGYITMDGAGYIDLTAGGREIASRIYERHRMIAVFLMALGVCEKTAFEDACKIEHDISEESFSCMMAHYRQYGAGKTGMEDAPHPA